MRGASDPFVLVHITLSVIMCSCRIMRKPREKPAQGKREFFTPRATCPRELFHVLFRVYLKPYTPPGIP